MAISYLVATSDLRHFGKVRRPSIRIAGIVIAECAVLTRSYPQREATSIGFSVYVRAGPDDDVHAQFLGELENRGDITGTGSEIHCCVIRCVVCPAGVESETCEASCFDFLEDVAP